MNPLNSENSTRSDPEPFSARNLLFRTAIGILILMGGLAIPISLYREEVLEFCRYFVRTAGGPGVFFGFMIPDMLPIPFAQDIFTGMAVFGGMSRVEAIIWAATGSLVGGSIGFFIGQRIARSKRFERFIKGRGAQAYTLVQDRGSLAVVIGAVTPIPYSFICWTCGALDYPYGRLILISLLRIPRIAFYLYLIETNLGWIIGLDAASLQ